MLNIFDQIVSTIIIVAFTIASFISTPFTIPNRIASIEKNISESVSYKGFNPAGGTTYRLQSSIGTTDTSVKLSSFKNRSSIPLTMTLLNTDIGYGTLSPQTSRSEFVSFSGITQNADGTATLTGVSRGLSDISPFTASTTLRQAHPGQSVFILSDSPQLFEEYSKRRNDETITGRWNFSTELPYSSITATTSSQLTNKAYVDAVAIQGAATSTETNGGVVELGTLAEQADSYDGGANKPTVLQTKNSTSTCQVVGSYNLVASSTSGKLDKGCLDQTLNYTFSGTNLFTASTTLSATTTILANSATNNALVLNTIPYKFPSIQGASSTVLTTNGSGSLIWSASDWEQIGETILASANATATVSSLPARRDLKLIIQTSLAGIGGGDATMRFNSDSGANYGYNIFSNYQSVVQGQASADTKILLLQPATTSPVYLVFDIENETTSRKQVIWNGSANSSGAIMPVFKSGAAVWNNTSDQINRIDLFITPDGGGSNQYSAGTRLTVYARRN